MDKPDDMPQEIWDAMPPFIKDMVEGGAVAVPVEVPTNGGMVDFTNPVVAMAWLDSWVSGVVKVCEQSDEDKELFDIRIAILGSNAKMLEQVADVSTHAEDLHRETLVSIDSWRQRIEFMRVTLAKLTEHPEDAPKEWQPHLSVITQIIRTDIYELAPMMVAIMLKIDELAKDWMSHPMEGS